MNSWILVILILIIGVTFDYSNAEQIPKWVKNNAGWWAEGQIPEDDFMLGLQYLIDKEILIVSFIPTNQESLQAIPEWIKNNVGWWADGLISDAEFVSSLQFLIENKILLVTQTEDIKNERFEQHVIELSECDDQIFTVPIVDVNKIYNITPLGNLGPPEHTLPTEHMYIQLTSEGVDLRAPADLRLISMSRMIYQETGTRDYSLEFSFCKDVHGYFLHIKTIDPELEKELEGCSSHVYGEGGKYDSCWAEIDREVNAGDILGTVGNDMYTVFDFGVYDDRTKLNYANPSRYSDRSSNITCPLEFYDKATKSELYNKISRTIDPKCGEVMQDVKGTLQGNWYFKSGDSTDWTEQLSLVHDNNDPSKAVISIGGIFADPAKWIFTPSTFGFINHEFASVTPGENIYCYQGEDPNRLGEEKPKGKIIVQLVSDTKLKIEYQDGSCTENFEFNNPVIYYR